MNHYVPQRGDDIWLDFNPQSGREQAGRHPAFVVSPEAYNRKVGLLVACPVTSQKKGYPSEVEIPDGFSVTGVTLSDQIKSMDWRVRNASQICSLPENIIQEVLQKVSTLLR